jgi:hypothetical protein
MPSSARWPVSSARVGGSSPAGTITAQEAGLVGLVAPDVANRGTITARLGTVALAVLLCIGVWLIFAVGLGLPIRAFRGWR